MTPTLVVAAIFACAGLLLVIVSLPLLLRKVAPNAFYGLRIPSTRRNERFWYEANALAGRLFAAVGVGTVVLGMIGALLALSPRTLALVSASFLVFGVILASIRCVLFARSLETQQGE